MNVPFYLPRKLLCSERTYTEEALLASARYVVILAEPGGGKTELLRSLGKQLQTSAVTANVFIHQQTERRHCPLVIDAFDELAKIDQSGIHRLLAKVKSASATHLIISSRSSEWGTAATGAFIDFIGQPPLIVRLCEFDTQEQRAIFDHHAPNEDFGEFQEEVARFALDALLPNPQFLKLFTDAYIESNRRFLSKNSIFSQAVERLAKEANAKVARTSELVPSSRKIELSSEVFAKLLLSGAEGVCTSEAAEQRTFPLIDSLIGDSKAESILATRLFKPGDNADQHRPVHKIVAEYCAAAYLTARFANPMDPLTLEKCLPIIAPNSTVRDELRGLLGWMASLGNGSVQEKAIELDAYAVLANGDPSQLQDTSKRALINQLTTIEAKDPYFRRGDFWRRFSAAGFFTPDVVELIKPLLARGGDGHLRQLILELLTGSSATEALRDELHQLVLSENENEGVRSLAARCLCAADTNCYALLGPLVKEASHSSLKIAAEIMKREGAEKVEQPVLAGFFRASAQLYPSTRDVRERMIGARYFIKTFIDGLCLPSVEWLLDELTKNLSCRCGKEVYECHCRVGISKVVGTLLDRYFDLAQDPSDPARIWRWIEKLNFHDAKTADQSKAVKVLQSNDALRQGVIACAFANLADRDDIHRRRTFGFDWHGHSGLSFRAQDYKFVIDLAFEIDNPALWAEFIANHQRPHSKGEHGINRLRRHMREQALAKPAFMRMWAESNRAHARFVMAHRFDIKHTRRMKRRRLKRDEVRLANLKYVLENRELVESGQHWGFLAHFSQLALTSPHAITQEFGDESLVRNALRNCLDFIAPNVPDLPELVELRCASQGLQVETILYAACLEILRSTGNLESVDSRLLEALRTNVQVHYGGVSNDDRNALKAEVDRLVFRDAGSAEKYLRQYVEPQLNSAGCRHPEVWQLRSEEVFAELRAPLSIEWLRRFRELAIEPLSSLFETAAQYGDRHELTETIRERCADIQSTWPEPTGDVEIENRREFWLLRAWYFLDDAPQPYWNFLKADKETVLLLAERSGQMGRSDNPAWPKLTPIKVEAILDAFFESWPKVELPSHWGTGSPKEENAYRFLTEVIWLLNSENPDEAIPVLNRLLSDPRFGELSNDLKSIRSVQLRKKALRDFEPPTVREVVDRLDHDVVVTVEDLRQTVLQELRDFQRAIDGGEFNTADRFYEKGERLGEVRSTEIIAERLSIRLEPQGISVTPEHQLKNANRSDFTATKVIRGRRRLLVAEVKGQWHKELYTAASAQLHDRYSIHPDAEQQGLFVVIWFGPEEEVAGYKRHGIKSAQELKERMEAQVPAEIKGLIDVFVLDVSKPRYNS